MAGQGILVHLDLMAHGLQALDAAAERRLVAHRARGGIDVDVARAMVVAAVVVVVVLGQGGVSHPCGRAPWLAGAIGKKAPRNQRRKYSTARAAKARASAG